MVARSCRWSDRSHSASRYRSSVLRARISIRGSTPTRVASSRSSEPGFQRREIHRRGRGHRRLATTCGRWSTWVEVLVTDTGRGCRRRSNPAPSTCSFRVAGTPIDAMADPPGLAIAQRLTTAPGGSPQIKKRTGEGTVFRIQLPVGEISLDHLNPNVRDPWRGGRLRSSGGRAGGEHGPAALRQTGGARVHR